MPTRRGGRPFSTRLPKDLPRLLTVGRLDIGTEGLLLLTNDGGLARVLELPETGWLRRYRVRAHGGVAQAELDSLRSASPVEGVHYGPIEATLDREQGANVWLSFAIREGKNREVRNVLGHHRPAGEPADPRRRSGRSSSASCAKARSRRSKPRLCVSSSAKPSPTAPAAISSAPSRSV